jgi:hypothetical protein
MQGSPGSPVIAERCSFGSPCEGTVCDVALMRLAIQARLRDGLPGIVSRQRDNSQSPYPELKKQGPHVRSASIPSDTLRSAD